MRGHVVASRLPEYTQVWQQSYDVHSFTPFTCMCQSIRNAIKWLIDCLFCEQISNADYPWSLQLIYRFLQLSGWDSQVRFDDFCSHVMTLCSRRSATLEQHVVLVPAACLGPSNLHIRSNKRCLNRCREIGPVV